MNGARYSQSLRRLVYAWLSLLVLLCLSAASARLHLGPWNLLLSVGIALIKVSIIVFVFMALEKSSRGVPRLVAATALLLLLVMAALSLVDMLPRVAEPTAWQLPQSIPATLRRQ